MRVEHQTPATVKVEHTNQQVIRVTAKKAFDVAGQHIMQGEVFFLVRSKSKTNEYHIVRWNEERSCYKCSCGAGCKSHAHNKAAAQYSKVHPYTKPIKVVHPWEVEMPAQTDVSKVVDISTKGNLNVSRGFSILKTA